MPKLGAHLNREELEGYLRGDRSRTAPSRGFVIWAHALGMLFSPDVSPTPSMILLFARRCKAVYERLADSDKIKSYWASVHTLTMVTAGNILYCMPQAGLLYIQKSCDLIKEGNLRFIPTCGPPPEFSEGLHKAMVPLSQIIYWANYMFLTHRGPEPSATADLEREFRQELPVGDIMPSRVST